LQPATKGWTSKAYTCSSLNHEGISDVWNTIQSFEQIGKTTGFLIERRKNQAREWLYSLITDQLQYHFFHHSGVKNALPTLENEVIAGEKTVATAVDSLFNLFLG
jgi:LAO/AO transport system kinase